MSDYPRQLRDFGSYNVMCEAADYIERIEAQLAEAERKLRVYGQHLPNCRSLVYLTSMPPKTQPCDCGLVTPDSAPAVQQYEPACPLCGGALSTHRHMMDCKPTAADQPAVTVKSSE